MSREILVLWAGRHRRKAWDELCTEYRRRIARDLPVRDQMIKARRGGDDGTRRRAEAQGLREALPDPCWSIALDPRGRATSSEQLAAKLSRLREEWPHPIAFLIGSDLGLDEDLLTGVRERLSFGPVVLGHELARLVLYEQVYRALSMGKGIKYHRPSF